MQKLIGQNIKDKCRVLKALIKIFNNKKIIITKKTKN